MEHPGAKSYQMGVCGIICVSLGVLGVKKFKNHWLKETQFVAADQAQNEDVWLQF